MRMRRSVSPLRGEPYGDRPSVSVMAGPPLCVSRPIWVPGRPHCGPSPPLRSGGALAPGAGDGESPVAAEVLRRDLGPRRVLPALVLGQVDQPDDPVDQLGLVTGRYQLGAAAVALDVVVEQSV